MGVNSLPKTVIRQRRGCDLNPGPSAPESSTLTTRLPSHPILLVRSVNCLQLFRQSLSGQAPLYLADDWRVVSDSTRRSLRSADVSTCVLPPTLSSYGDRTFAAAGPRLWNSLPVQLRNPDITYGLFRRQLKRHLFGKHAHGALWLLICGAIEKNICLLTYSAPPHEVYESQKNCLLARTTE